MISLPTLFRRILPALLLPALFALAAFAGEPTLLHLKDGGELTGLIEEIKAHEIVWQGGDGELWKIPLSRIERLEFPAQSSDLTDAKSASDAADSQDGPAEQETAVEAEPELEPISETRLGLREKLFLSVLEDSISGACGPYDEECQQALTGMAKWTQRFELGARFRDGNSEEDFVDIGSKLERADSNHMLSFDFGGQYARANKQPTANRWFGNGTVDINREGNWILFVSNRNEFDEFENLDYRGTLASGVGYRFYNEVEKRLVVRLGPGATHQKFHSPRLVQTTPDLFGEVELRWPLFDRTLLEHKTTVTPNLEDFQVFRLQSNYGVVVQLDEHERWSVIFGLQHDYNSRPNVNNLPSDYVTGIRLLYVLK